MINNVPYVQLELEKIEYRHEFHFRFLVKHSFCLGQWFKRPSLAAKEMSIDKSTLQAASAETNPKFKRNDQNISLTN